MFRPPGLLLDICIEHLTSSCGQLEETYLSVMCHEVRGARDKNIQRLVYLFFVLLGCPLYSIDLKFFATNEEFLFVLVLYFVRGLIVFSFHALCSGFF